MFAFLNSIKFEILEVLYHVVCEYNRLVNNGNRYKAWLEKNSLVEMREAQRDAEDKQQDVLDAKEHAIAVHDTTI